ncbi:MAG: hypothetical protein WC081_04700 [Candidatus Ratteibacteria bacterium]
MHTLKWEYAKDITLSSGSDAVWVDAVSFSFGTTYTINASAGPHGAISPSGVVIVAPDATPTFTIIPGVGYHLATCVVGGTSVDTGLGLRSSYIFDPVNADSTIAVSFAASSNSISGKVTKDAVGLEGVTVTLSSLDLPLTDPKITTTGADGMYYFNSTTTGDIMTGNYTITPTLTGYVFIPVQIELKPFAADAPLSVIDIVAYPPFEIETLSGTPNPVIENGSVACSVTASGADSYLWTVSRGHFLDTEGQTSTLQNPTWVADILMADNVLFEAVELRVTAYADPTDGRSVSASYSQQVNKLPVPVINSSSGGGGGAVGPLAVGISALLGWWKRRRKVVRPFQGR